MLFRVQEEGVTLLPLVDESGCCLEDQKPKDVIPSGCCSLTFKTSLAAIAWVTVGGALTTASTLVYMNQPIVAFLIALHAPQVVVIAVAVVGALMAAYGLYLALRVLSEAKAPAISATLARHSCFSGAEPDYYEDVEAVEEKIPDSIWSAYFSGW